jgi:hypothetical protein
MALSISDLITLIDTNLPDNNTNLIDPQAHREVLYEIIESYANLITNTDDYGLSSFDSSSGYFTGQCVVYIDKNIYQANTDVNTGAWNPLQWDIISSYIESTAGLDIYRKIENSIYTPDHKAIYLGDDVVLTGLDTGFYVVNTNNAALVGIDKDYPQLGKGLLINQKGISASETFQIYYNFSDYTTSYARKETSVWVANTDVKKDSVSLSSTAGTLDIDCGLYENIFIENSGDLTMNLINKSTGVYVISVRDNGGMHYITPNSTFVIKSNSSLDDVVSTVDGGIYVYTVVITQSNTLTYYTLEYVNV